jgi:hypothetical protein
VSSSTRNDVPRSTREQRDAAARNAPDRREHRPVSNYFEATPCEGPGCTNIVPAGMYPARRTRHFCSDECRSRWHNRKNQPHRTASERGDTKHKGYFGVRPPETRYFEAVPCEGPGCTNIVPAGTFPAQLKHRFCRAPRYLVWIADGSALGRRKSSLESRR